MEKTETMKSKGGIAKFQEMSKDWENNPKILRKIIENLSEKIDELQAKATAYDSLVSKTVMSDAELDAPLAQRILREMCEKAEAYDRLMGGGKKTLKELANFLGMNVAVEDEPIYGRRVFASPTKMFLKTNTTIYGTYKFWALSENGNIFQIPSEIVDFKGDWTTSLTLPDGWEDNHAK